MALDTNFVWTKSDISQNKFVEIRAMLLKQTNCIQFDSRQHWLFNGGSTKQEDFLGLCQSKLALLSLWRQNFWIWGYF